MAHEKKILVVDDLPSARKIVTRLLKKLGYDQVTEVSDGEAALQAIQTKSFDLVISDWHMPKMDGLELFRSLRNTQNGAKSAFLFVTSSNEREDVISALQAGVREYLCKPFSSEALEEKLKTLLGSSA